MLIKTKNSTLYFQIDLADFDKIRHYYWYYEPNNKSIRGWVNGKKVFLHRFLTNPPVNMVVDHKNNNRLDCRQENLRICEPNKNQLNKRKTSKPSTSKFKGVSALTNGKFRARITIDGKVRSLGIFATEEEAAKIYDLKAKEFHGEFCNLNFN